MLSAFFMLFYYILVKLDKRKFNENGVYHSNQVRIARKPLRISNS